MVTGSDRSLANEKYVLLTTFRANGDPVRTPVWAAVDAGEVVLWTVRQSGKVKRLRREGRVELRACDVRGSRVHGPVFTGRARLCDDAESDRVRAVLRRKYGIVGWFAMALDRLRGGNARTIGIAITVDE